MKEFLQKHEQYLLAGVPHVIPMIACGGIFPTALTVNTLKQLTEPRAPLPGEKCTP